MDLERAIEKQRDALLRHLAILFAIVAFFSIGPFANRLPRFVRSYVLSILRPAEAAADCLVRTMARVMARSGADFSAGTASQVSCDARHRHSARKQLGTWPKDDLPIRDTVCSDGLLARMRALQAKLRDLPGYARRLLREGKKRVARRNRRIRPALPVLSTPGAYLSDLFQSTVCRIEPPPILAATQSAVETHCFPPISGRKPLVLFHDRRSNG